MSYPRRDHRLPPIAPGDTPRQTPLDAIPTTNEDLGPTGEHMMELSGSDLEVEDLDNQAAEDLAPTPRAVRPAQAEAPGPGPYGPHGQYSPPPEYGMPQAGPVTHSPSPLFPDEAQGIDPMAETIPPEAPYDLAEPALDDDVGDEVETLDNAPTRIEREEDIRASFEGVPAHGPRLLIIGGNNRGHEHPLKMADNSIGRGVDNDIILADIAVSRKHTLVCYEGTSFVVRDLGSGNGTLLNGKRVDSCPLKDGDQLELGNTLMRFVNPLEGEMNQAALAQLETRVSARGEEAVQLTADVRPRPAADMGVTRRERRGALIEKLAGLVDTRPKKLMVFGGLALLVLFGTLIALKAVMGGKKPPDQQRQLTKPAQPPDELAARAFTEGIAQYRARNWEKARVHFLKVVQLVPSADHAKRYADQAAAEITARNALKRAKNSLTAKDFDTARRELAKVHSTSEYASEAQSLKQKVDDQQLSQLLEAVKSLKGAGDVDGARAKLKEAQEIAPTNPEVLKLAAELRGKTVAVRPPGQRRPVHGPRRGRRPGPRRGRRPGPRRSRPATAGRSASGPAAS